MSLKKNCIVLIERKKPSPPVVGMTNLSLGKEIGREADPPRTFTPKKMENDQMLFVTIYFFNCVFPIQGR